MDYFMRDVEDEIAAISNCIECQKTDGCYNCRCKKPTLALIKTMLEDLECYMKDIGR